MFDAEAGVPYLGGFVPVSRAGPGMGRQRHGTTRPRPRPRTDRFHPMRVHPRPRRHQAPALVFAAPHRRKDRRSAGGRPALADRRAQDGVWTDLEEGREPAPLHLFDGVGEPDGPADIVPPVVGCEPAGLHGPRRHRRNERNLRFNAFGRTDGLEERFPNRLDQGRMEPQPHRQGPPPHASLRQQGLETLHRRRVAGQGDHLRTVHRRHARVPPRRRRQFPRFVFGQRRGHHPARQPVFLQANPAVGHDVHRLLEAQGARSPGGGDLARAVAHDGGRPDAPRPPEFRQRYLDREQRGLGDRGLLQAAVAFVAAQLLDDRASGQGPKGLLASFHRFAKNRFASHQFQTHARPMGALAAEDEPHVGGGRRRRPGVQARAALAVAKGSKRLERFLERGRRETQAVTVMRAPRPGRMGDVGQVRAPRLFRFEEPCPAFGQCPERFRAPRREDQGEDLRRRGLRRFGSRTTASVGPRLRPELGQHHVGVGAAEPEGVHADEAGAVVGPGLEAGGHAEPQPFKVDGRIGRVEVEAGRDLPVLQHQDGLDHARHAGRRLEMAHVGLDRADGQRLAVAATRSEDAAQGLRLRRVARGRARAVGLHVAHVFGIDAGAGVHLLEQRRLGIGIGQRYAAGPAVLVGARGQNYRLDGVAVAQGFLQALQHQHARALGPDESVGRGVEGLAPTRRRQHGRRREHDEGLLRDDGVHAAGEGQVGLAVRQALHGPVEGRQRRRARRVHAEAGAAQVEAVGKPVRRDAHARARGREGGESALMGRQALDAPVVGRRDADENARARPRQPPRGYSRALQRFPGGFEQQPLLRVDVDRLARRHAETFGFEFVQPVEEAAPPRYRPTQAPRVRTVKGLDAPSIRRNLADGVAPASKQFPEFRAVLRPAGKPTTVTEYRNRSHARHAKTLSLRASRRAGSRPPRGKCPAVGRQSKVINLSSVDGRRPVVDGFLQVGLLIERRGHELRAPALGDNDHQVVEHVPGPVDAPAPED